MKKLLAAIVAAAMILSLAIVAPVSAETRDLHATFIGDTCEGEPGDTVDYIVSIDGDFEFHGLTMEINYDPNVLTLNSYTLGPVLSALPTGAMAMPDNSISGSFRLGVMCAMDGITATGDMITLNFTIADDAQPGTYPIEFVITGFTYMPIGGEAEDIEYELENGSIVVEGEEPPAVEIIDLVNITGFTAPEWGANPDFDVEVPSDAHYTIRTASWFWSYGDEGGLLEATDAYDNEDYEYIMNIIIVADEGYDWPEGLKTADLTVTINGSEEYVGEYFVDILQDGTEVLWIRTVPFTVTNPDTPPTEEPPTEEPPTEEPPTEEPPTEEPPTEEPPTEVPPTEEPTDQPTPPTTGAITMIGLGVAAVATAAGVVIFRKKED